MKITIESTTKIVSIRPSQAAVREIECRVWEGVTESGIKVQCLIPRIAAPIGEDQAQFERELKERRPPSNDFAGLDQAFPMRMIL